ncbi:hypothetical protein [Dysosmobacter sp.]|uniref:hypothetical protein n=1 Tax=Dysosmobacter sp. TaxID=2591382 RepID=UPI002A866A44|nr:hypothetical protein [Dysosmobacter sp.]MDY3983958.1 hypothetical protein [Dysosmobacter sp.]
MVSCTHNEKEGGIPPGRRLPRRGTPSLSLLRDVSKRPETFQDLKSIQAKVRELCGHTDI